RAGEGYGFGAGRGGNVGGADIAVDGVRARRDARALYQLAPGVASAEYGRNAPPPPSLAKDKAAAGKLEEQQQEPAVQVRSDFRSTILWLPDVKTDADGTATVKV